uniref:Uncharacterized protein n=1 Tax=Utricularia reniformis TaxID=192314 RepID=A0A1Y0B294_9LAMI|nr:hypothetical protein AEK19_MT1289 [Utricularia reniformis]ART31493.1 hypothetical protein AEK19_MT1289 [Utricularia reniformis]
MREVLQAGMRFAIESALSVTVSQVRKDQLKAGRDRFVTLSTRLHYV